MKLYHGTNLTSAFNICVSGIDLSCSEKFLDFGAGFYTTDDKWKAIQRALKKTNDFNKKNNTYDLPYLVEIMVDFEVLHTMNIKEFSGHDLEWCQFVLNNRLEKTFLKKNKLHHNRDNKYDIVIGEIADGTIANIAFDVRNGKLNINDIDYDKFLTTDKKSYGNQVSFHTEKSLSCIVGVSCDIIKLGRRMKGGE